MSSKTLYTYIAYPISKFMQTREFRDSLAKAICCAGGSSGGGIQSIVAGTNITVDNTDPLNPIISATGGGADTTAWHKTGDSVSAGNFIGTANSQPLILKSNNIEGARLATDQKFLIGTTINPGNYRTFSDGLTMAGIGAQSDSSYAGYFDVGNTNTSTALYVNRNNTSANIAEFYSPSSNVKITADGSIILSSIISAIPVANGTGKLVPLTITTTGTSGPATLTGTTLNIPQYSGGGGTPAGSNTQIQYNNSGAFGASSNFTYSSSVGLAVTASGAYTTLVLNDSGNAPAAIWSFAGTPGFGIFGIPSAGQIVSNSQTLDSVFRNLYGNVLISKGAGDAILSVGDTYVGIGTRVATANTQLDVIGTTKTTNIYTNSATPSAVLGTGAGSGAPTITFTTGSTNQTGVITLVTGTTPLASNVLFTLTFSNSFAAPNRSVMMLYPQNDNASLILGNGSATIKTSSANTTSVVATTGTIAPTAATTYIFGYHIMHF